MKNDYQNIEFLNVYVELENYLKTITNFPDYVGVIGLYEKILPSKRSSTIATIRGWRNNLQHGSKVDGETTTIPFSAITRLKSEIEYIKENEEEVANKLKALYEKKNKYSFSSALEGIYRRCDKQEELSNPQLMVEKLQKNCVVSTNNTKLILRYYDIDKKLHLFQSIAVEKKDLRQEYYKFADDMTEGEFVEILQIVERIVNNGVVVQKEGQTQSSQTQQKPSGNQYYRRRTGFHWWKVEEFFEYHSVGIFIAGCLMIALLAVLGNVVNLPTTMWQWLIGAVGGFAIFSIATNIIIWLDDGIVVAFYALGSILLSVCIVTNFILFLILRSDYKIIFGFLSIWSLIFGTELTCKTFEDVEEGWGVFQIIALVVALLLLVIVFCWM